MRNQYILLPKKICQKVAQVSVYNYIFLKDNSEIYDFSYNLVISIVAFCEVDSTQMIPFLRECLPKYDCTSKEYASMKTEELSISFTHKSIYYH